MNKSVCNFRLYSIYAWSSSSFPLHSFFLCNALLSPLGIPLSHLLTCIPCTRIFILDDFHIILLRIDYYSSIVSFHHISYHSKEKWTILFIYLFVHVCERISSFSLSMCVCLHFSILPFFAYVLATNNIRIQCFSIFFPKFSIWKYSVTNK